MKIITRRGTIEVDTPTLNELAPLVGASLHGLLNARSGTLSEGAQAIREAILTVAQFPLPDTVTLKTLPRIQPPHGIGGAYVINTAPGTPSLEYLYRSVGSKDQRTRVFVGRIKACAQELVEVAGPASSPADEIGPWLIQASLLLKQSLPGTARRLDEAEAQKKILDFIVTYRDEHGYPPNFTEIAETTGMVRSVVARHMGLMRDTGVIEYKFRSQRSIKVLSHG